MPPRSETPSKKPSGGRPLPRRLFSFDSLRKERSGSGAEDSDSIIEVAEKNGSRLALTEKTISETPEDPFADSSHWTEKELVASPEIGEDGSEPGFKRKGHKPAPLNLSKSGSVASSGPPPSPSRRRWDTVRQHVLPTATPPSISSPLPSPPPDSSSSFSARPSTPKFYKLGQKRALRQVVETAQAQQVHENKKFGETIWRACWAARFGDISPHPAKPEREPTLAAMGSTLHLPFMASTPSLPSVNSPNPSMLSGVGRVPGLRRPPSVQSLAMTGRAAPSVTHIARALNSTMSMNRPRHLPHETLVLSALLLPFVSNVYGNQSEIEQAIAVETFEYAIRAWRADSHEASAELERCIWCCKAAAFAPNSRQRVLGTLSSILFSRDKTFATESPVVLQTLLQVLFSLQYLLSISPSATAEAQSVASYIAEIRAGECGQLSRPLVEKEFGVRFSSQDNEDMVFEAIVAESAVRCLDAGPPDARRWALRTLVEQLWPLPEPNLKITTLQACIIWRKLKTFVGAALSLLSDITHEADEYGEIMISLLRTRILPEIGALREEESAEIRSKLIQVVLELLAIRESEGREYLLMHFCDWYQQGGSWKEGIEAALTEIISHSEWALILRTVPPFIHILPSDLRLLLLSYVLPLINKRLVGDPPDGPYPTLSHFLETISRGYPKLFFKPLFTCAAASKDVTIANQLATLDTLSRFVPDMYTRDAEMITVALVSEAGPKATTDGQSHHWSTPRLGQLALLSELVERLRSVQRMRDMGSASNYVKFAAQLEIRIAAAIEAKEKTMPLPLSHRVLFGVLFREIRLLVRSLKAAPWLPNVISWIQSWTDTELYQEALVEIRETYSRLDLIYSQAGESFGRSNKRRTTLLSLSPDPKIMERARLDSDASPNRFGDRQKSVLLLSRSSRLSLLDLLVTVSGMLSQEDYGWVGPVIWQECLTSSEGAILSAACFVFMQFAEKCPDECTRLVESDLLSADPALRRTALERISVLATWRFQILSQEVILDRNHRRPFKLQRPPVLFVATDIGSSLFIYEDDTDEYKDINGHVIPLELRRRLSEIGWEQEDRIVDYRMQRVKTPMSLLPTQHLERLDGDTLDPPPVTDVQTPSPEPSPTKASPSGSSLARRDSHSSYRPGFKRRPVFVPALVALFPSISAMISDPDYSVASTATELVMDFMRDDPPILARTVFQLISSDDQGVTVAISTLRAFLHVRHTLPPAIAHHVLNHLAGFLKSSVKQAPSANALRGFAYSIPVIAKLVSQVTKLSMRDIRRAKVDMLMIPSGSLWFSPNAPVGPMFPRGHDSVAFDEVPPNLVWITMIRTSQNLLFLNMLRRNAQDIKVIRKNMARFELPGLKSSMAHLELTLTDMIPRKPTIDLHARSRTQITLTALSLTLARSYLLLIQQIFQCLPRHLNDREELAVLIDGLVRILLAHGDDIGIVAHVLLALMTASTRFKRLFNSGGGYTLFMPAVIKTYIEAEYNPNIRYAIAYTVNRFYALHLESFIFQTFDRMSQVLALPNCDGPWVAGGIYALFSTLRSAVTNNSPDAAGIHNLNKAQEQEALMVSMAEEVPQTFMDAIKKRPGGKQNALVVPIPEEYETRRLKLDDIVRLFLTVIAHNPTVQRAEHFFKFLRLLTPHLYDASRPVQTVLRGGIDALGGILTNKVLGKAKDYSQARPTETFDFEAMSQPAPSAGENSRSASSDLSTIRLEYLFLVEAYAAAGGRVGGVTTMRIVDIVKVVLRDSKSNADKISTFLAEYVRNSLMHEGHPPAVKEAVSLLGAIAPLAAAYVTTVDLSGLYRVLAELCANPVLAADPAFSQMIVCQFCRIGLDACEAAASQDYLFAFPLRTALIKLMISAVNIAGTAVMEEIERQPSSYSFLAGIVLPIVLTLKTSSDVINGNWGDGWRRDTFTRVWLRMLSLVLAVMKGVRPMEHTSEEDTASERRKSRDSRMTETSYAPVKAFGIALQILKIIVTRAAQDISDVSPGIWTTVSNGLKAALADGSAAFALRYNDYSEPPSPALSPRGSKSFDQPPTLSTFPSSISMHSRRPLTPPRMIDYLTWSLIQWLWLHRSPLMIQMRIFVQERIADLAAELRQQGQTSISGASSRRSRRVSTVFSKPRRSMLGPSPSSSPGSTPRTSTFFSNSISLPVVSDFAPTGLSASASLGSRQAGYARMPSPVSPTGRTSQDSNTLKIVHLGPVNPYSAMGTLGAARPSQESEGLDRNNSVRGLAKGMSVNSPGLVRLTYRRIRLIQRLMGFTDLLPMNGSDYFSDEDDPDVRAWSQKVAIEAVVSETKELLEEFRESFGDVGDESMVVVDSQITLLQD